MLMDTLRALCPLFGPSGYEDPVRDYILQQAEPYADRVEITPAGALLVHKKGRAKPKHRVVLAAHMDEVALLIKSIDEDGFLKFSTVGGIDRRVLPGKQVFIGDKRIPGVIGMKPIHLTEDDELEKVPDTDDLYIDIGADKQEEAEKLTERGDYACFDPEFLELENGFVCSKAIDDRIGCAVMLELIKEELPVDTWFAFTVQEEIGSRGAFGAAFTLNPESALVLEGTSAADVLGREKDAQICAPLKGPVLSLVDKGSVYDRELFRLLCQLADETGTGWQVKTRLAGSTDARAFQKTQGGCRVCGVSAPIRYIHSPSNVGNVKDFEAMKVLVHAFLEKMEDYDG